jgi:hypothetical protein
MYGCNTKYHIGYLTLLSIRENKFEQVQATNSGQSNHGPSAEGTEHIIHQHLLQMDSRHNWSSEHAVQIA